MDDQYVPLIENNKKSTAYKKYGAALGVAGITVAAALLLSGNQKAPTMPQELIEMSDEMIDSNITELAGVPETCLESFDRIWAGDEQTYGSVSLDANGKYQDPSFPADSSSLWWEVQEESGANHGQVESYRNYQNQYGIVWKRPSELPGTPNPSLWGSNGVSPKASKQGVLGDCWFLSSASAVAAVPSRIKSMFANTEYSTNGAFEMYFYLRGKKVSVVIDDRIPVLNLGDNYTTPYPPINSKPSPAGAWWLVLLEKAFAKVNINYTQLNAGTPGEALRAITGMPVSQHNSNEITDDQLWTMVMEGTKANNPMAAACNISHYNLIGGHAYGILKGLCLTDDYGDCVHKIIQMRNPWGLSKYTGPWSEDSDLWTPAWKQQANLAGADEGEFWVPLDQWRTLFAQAFNTHYREDWKQNSIEGEPSEFTTNEQQNGFVSFENPVQQDVVIDCLQWEARLFPAGCKTQYTPITYGFILHNNQYGEITTSPQQGQCNGGAMKVNLPAGKFQIQVFSFPGGGGSGDHKQIWKMRVFSGQEQVTNFEQAPDPYSN